MRSWGEGEGDSMHVWGSAFIGVEGGGLMVSWTHCLLVNLKRKNGNLKNEKRIKNKWPK